MFKCIKTLIFVLLIFASFSVNVEAEDITSINNLIENAKEFDEQEVLIQGEAIGERMDRGNYSWININDGTNAIGIWMNKKDAEKVEFFGNYKNKGDKIKIYGTFHRACREHGGEADLHLSSIEITEKGNQIDEQISNNKVIVASSLFLLAVLFLLYFKYKIN